MTRWGVMLLVAALVARAPTAGAEEDDKAYELFKQGVDLAKDGKYEEAIKAFEEARMRGAPDETLFNLGKCYEGLGLFHVAVDYYQQYLESAGAKHKEKIETIIEELRIKPSALSFRSEPPGAEVRQVLEDGTEAKMGVTPFEHTAEAGEFTFIVTKTGFGEKKVTITTGYGKPYDLEISLSKDDVQVEVIDKSKTLEDFGEKPAEPDEPGEPDEPEKPEKPEKPAITFPRIGLAAELGTGPALMPYPKVDFQAGGIITFGLAYRFKHGVESGFSVGLRFTFRSYQLVGSEGTEDREWLSFITHILAVPGYQFRLTDRLGLELTLPLGIAIISPTGNLPDTAWIDLVGGRIQNGNVSLFDLGLGAALRIKVVSALYVTVEPIRLHLLMPFKPWGNNTKVLADLDIVARIGFEF